MTLNMVVMDWRVVALTASSKCAWYNATDVLTVVTAIDRLYCMTDWKHLLIIIVIITTTTVCVCVCVCVCVFIGTYNGCCE
jgi:hypothetical protein